MSLPVSRPSRRFALAWLGRVVALGAIFLFVVTQTLAARPGGGGSFSGGSRSSGGSSGRSGSSGSRSGRGSSGGGYSPGPYYGGGGSTAPSLFALLFGGPLLAFFIIVVVVALLVVSKRKPTQWSTRPALTPRRSPRSELERAREFDANFSLVLFEDFLYALYAEVQKARGAGELHRMSAYLGPQAAAALLELPVAPVTTVVVGSMQVLDVEGLEPSSPALSVEVGFETNYTEGERSYYAREQWRLTRGRGAPSRTPDRVRVFGCPHCGAPQEYLFGGNCRHCAQTVNNGAFDWVVSDVAVEAREQRGPMLTGDTEEVGTDLPTIVDPEAEPRMHALMQRDPGFDWRAFEQRVALIFSEFQVAWAARDLAKMRPFLSDGLFQTQLYWTETYRAQRLRNITENTRMTNIVLARVTNDAFFDSITVRAYATGLDYTITDEGRVVAGSRSKPRVYSEYWTLVRSSQRQGAARADLACPNCGAPLAINMAGHCQYCSVKVTTGEFDWVLSRIEQDEVYAG